MRLSGWDEGIEREREGTLAAFASLAVSSGGIIPEMSFISASPSMPDG